ncbi:MAG: GNAT family N-acetyltransferase [Sedimentibacter sp.]|uniref:GNAT family N-acetyltransferase n=1 Tax=Sedimentibacter sp. TaxID=1960295 RepID=UPI0031588FB1
MIRKLSERDKEDVLNFLMEEASYNLFIIGDILNTGFDEDFMEIWGDFGGEGKINGVLLRYYGNFIPYWKSCELVDTEKFKKIISSHSKKKLVSGKYDIVVQFTDALKEFNASRKFFCELKDASKLPVDDGKYEIRTAEVSDAGRLSDFIESIDEFNNTGEDRDMLENSIRTGSGRFYFIEDANGSIVCAAGTSAETDYAAMVVDVATSPTYRNRGMASRCLSKLCKDTLKDCNNICLFYSNEKAGSIYHRIGFETTGNWMIAAEI